MDAFAWGVIGSIATVVGTGAAIFIPLWQNRRAARRLAADTAGVEVRIGQYFGNYVERPPVPAASEVAVIVGEIPQAPQAFQRRENLVAALATDEHGVVLVHALTGMRGVGKTQIAAAYARSRIDAEWRLVAWVNAAERASVLTGLGEAASRLGLGEPGGSLESAALAVRHWLEAGGERCLVVFDNVTDLDHLSRFLPAAGGCQVILTSNQVEAGSFGSAVPVDVFTEEQALAFLAQRTGLADEQGAHELGGELGWLPLALAQAGAVIAIDHLDYPAYLARLRAHPVRKAVSRAKGEPYPHGTAKAVKLALDAAAKSDPTGFCRPLMDVVSLLSEAGVPREILRAAGKTKLSGWPGGSGQIAADDVDSALGQLASASLLTFSFDNSAVIVHRLTIRVVLELQAANSDTPKIGAAVADLLHVITDSLAEPWQSRPAARDTVQQITALHDHLARYVGEDNTTLTSKLLRLRQWAIWCLYELSDSFSRVIDLGPLVVADSERVLGPRHPDTLLSRNVLAYAFQTVGRVGEAIPLFERTLVEYERLLGPLHPDTLSSRNNLALAYQAAGRAGEAIPLFELILADYERKLRPGHPDTLRLRNNLATAYQAAGRVDEAIPSYESAPADHKRVLDTDPAEAVTSRSNLATAYQVVGQLGGAIPLYERALADRERLLRRDHPNTPNTLQSWKEFGRAIQAAGGVSEAIPRYERALADHEEVLGLDHPDTMRSRTDLAFAYQAAGRVSEAIPLYARVLADRERVLGLDHPDTLTSRNNLALAYQAAGHVAEAIPLYELALADGKRVLGPDDPDTRALQNNLAAAYENAGRPADAEVLRAYSASS